jgi:hypothetical protein
MNAETKAILARNARIALKGLKLHPRMSEDTNAFDAQLCFDSKPVATALDRGFGGDVEIDALRGCSLFDARAYVEELLEPTSTTANGEPVYPAFRLEDLVAYMVEAEIVDRKLRKKCEKYTVFYKQGDPTIYYWTRPYTPELANKIRAEHPHCEIVNERYLSPDDLAQGAARARLLEEQRLRKACATKMVIITKDGREYHYKDMYSEALAAEARKKHRGCEIVNERFMSSEQKAGADELAKTARRERLRAMCATRMVIETAKGEIRKYNLPYSAELKQQALKKYPGCKIVNEEFLPESQHV